MSHFVVIVRVGAEQLAEAGSVENAIAKLLAPYQEDCTKEFLTFNDVTEEHEKKYETDSASMVRLADGASLSAFDNRFRNPAPFTGPQWVYPTDAERYEQPVKQLYTLDEYITDYCGYQRDEETGRYGYWYNPNKKWDWYQIGGRWTGFFPVRDATLVEAKGRLGQRSTLAEGGPKSGHVDAIRVSEIDWDAVSSKTRENADKFHVEWLRFIAGERFQAFDGPRSQAIRVGLLKVVQGDPAPEEKERAIPWRDTVSPDDSRVGWHDVWTPIARDELLTKYAGCFSPLSCHALLDSEGWFGCSSDEPADYVTHQNSVAARLRSAPADSWLVAVDCHI